MKSGLIVDTKDILVQRDSDTTSNQMLTDPRAPAALGPRLDAGATDDRSDRRLIGLGRIQPVVGHGDSSPTSSIC